MLAFGGKVHIVFINYDINSEVITKAYTEHCVKALLRKIPTNEMHIISSIFKSGKIAVEFN